MKKFLSWNKAFYIVLGLVCVLSIPFVALGMYKIYDISNTDTLVVCVVFWILFFVVSLILLIFSYKEQLEKQSSQKEEIEYLKSLNKQMYSDVLNYETTIQELKAQIGEKQ